MQTRITRKRDQKLYTIGKEAVNVCKQPVNHEFVYLLEWYKYYCFIKVNGMKINYSGIRVEEMSETNKISTIRLIFKVSPKENGIGLRQSAETYAPAISRFPNQRNS